MDYIIIDEMDCGCEGVKPPSIMDGVREVIAKSKKIRLKKEALTLLLRSAKEYQKIKEAEKKFNKFVEDNKLSKEILKEARGLTKEDIESIEEFMGSDTSTNGNTYGNFVNSGLATSYYQIGTTRW